MRELSVYYCKKCGRYGFYQLSKNAVCPNCDLKMILLDMHYQAFMKLDYDERDTLLSQKIIEASPSLIERLVKSSQEFNSRAVIAGLTTRVTELENENKKLEETVSWMHQTIWEFIRNRPPEE